MEKVANDFQWTSSLFLSGRNPNQILTGYGHDLHYILNEDCYKKNKHAINAFHKFTCRIFIHQEVMHTCAKRTYRELGPFTFCNGSSSSLKKERTSTKLNWKLFVITFGHCFWLIWHRQNKMGLWKHGLSVIVICGLLSWE